MRCVWPETAPYPLLDLVVRIKYNCLPMGSYVMVLRKCFEFHILTVSI